MPAPTDPRHSDYFLIEGNGARVQCSLTPDRAADVTARGYTLTIPTSTQEAPRG